MSSRSFSFLTAVSVLALCSGAALAAPTPRPTPVAGAIVATKGGEELRFAREGDWRSAELQQQLIGGDALRTNAIGNLAILFADQTQVRVGRNSSLVVNEVAGVKSDATQLELSAGQVWARASRGGSGVDVKTPAATAAIRGTDWSLSVEGNKTSLIVLEGVVELKNPQGSVTVRQGEGAVATLGQKPTKFVLVNSNDREQMLFHTSLRDGFTDLSPTALKSPQQRAERTRLQVIPPQARSAEDWLTVAELALVFDGRAAATAALAEARARPLSGAQRARADLVEGLLAGRARRWSEAQALFARAERGLDPPRQAVAGYGRYVAASLADPKRVQPEPRLAGGPHAAVAKAMIVGFQKDLPAAAEVLKAAEKQYPNDVDVALASAQVAFFLNRRDDVRASLARARALDPEHHMVLAYGAVVKGDLEGDVEGALADLRQAAEIAPGRAAIWNTMGLAEGDRDHVLAAEEALRRAIAEDPDDPVGYINLAIQLLDQSRTEEAAAMIEKAFEVDPAFHIGYVMRGRLLVQQNENARAIESILSGTAANPGHANSLLVASAAYYQNGEYELAQQALDNAERLDPNDPVVSMQRTAYALDQYQADEAILNSREALRRFRARGGYFSGLSVNRQGGSYMASAYRFLSLEEWGRYYGDRVFNPFSGTSYFDQAASRRPKVLTEKPTLSTPTGGDGDLTSFNLLMKGLLFDPLAIASRTRQIDVLRRPFIDGEVGGTVTSHHGRLGYQADAYVSGSSNLPIPISFAINVSGGRPNERNVLFQEETNYGSVFIGAQPTASDRLLAFADFSKGRPGLVQLTDPTLGFDHKEGINKQLGLGWSHSFSDRNVFTAAVFHTRNNGRQTTYGAEQGIFQTVDPSYLGFPTAPGYWLPRLLSDDAGRFEFVGAGERTVQARTQTEGTVAALNHTVGFVDIAANFGIEAQTGQARSVARVSNPFSLLDLTSRNWFFWADPPLPIGVFDADFNVEQDRTVKAPFEAGRGYLDVTWKPSDRFEFQVGAQVARYTQKTRDSLATRADHNFYNYESFYPILAPFDPLFDITGPYAGRRTSTGNDVGKRGETRFDPRLGVAFAPLEGQWFRAAYRQDTALPLDLTLSPLSTVGLFPNTLPLATGARTETAALRWDAEWHPRFFTSVEYQRQNIRGEVDVDGPYAALSLPIGGTLATYDFDRARIDRVSATANAWLGYGIGVFGTVGMADTENLSRQTGIYGGQLPFIAERFARFGATFAHPSRLRFTLATTFAGDRTGDLAGTKLDDYWSADAAVTWETPDRRLLVGLTALNLFDRRYELAPNLPGPGRTVAATLKARF